MFGSHFMIGLEGDSLSSFEVQFLTQEQIAGVILFTRNLKSFQQVHNLCLELKSLNLKKPLLIGIDMEGGKVDRFSHLPNSFSWPSAFDLSCLSEEDIFKVSHLMAKVLKSLNIDINFAPVIDPLLKTSPLLKTRSFGKTRQDILKKASRVKKGLLTGGITPCLKHFPGHGGVLEDSHKSLPQDLRPLQELQKDMDLFQKLQEDCCIMTAHVQFSKVDPCPATFSKIFLKKELREKRKFSNLIISDDIDMLALKKFSPKERSIKALRAGCDLILSCQKKETYIEALQQIKQQKFEEGFLQQLKSSQKRISKIKTKIYNQKDFQKLNFKDCLQEAYDFLKCKALI